MFKEKLRMVPELPGSYQMKNNEGIIIYVGKAKNLKNRLKSYFNGTVTGKTLALVNEIADFQYIVTNNELEALILEITLIKKYNPKYNVLLKDDKSYPYIELTNEVYPRLKIVRNIKRKKKKTGLFGPYPNVKAARKTVNIINRIYPLRKCESLPKNVCLYYHLGECFGYCKYPVAQETLNSMMEEITSFLKGNNKIITDRINQEIIEASKHLNYEKALELKKMLDDINITLRKQNMDLNRNANYDIFGYYQIHNYLSITVFNIKEGLLFGQHNFIINTLDIKEDMLHFIINYYEQNNLLPKELIVGDIIDQELLSEYLQIKVNAPQRGILKKLLAMANENALVAYQEKEAELNRSLLEKEKGIKELEELLKIKKASRIEAFDNSHLFGTCYVGGMVVFDHFEPMKNDYRKFKLDITTKDDLTAMKEVIYRRYYRVLLEHLEKPDIIIVDGGKLQVGAAKEAIDSLKLNIKIIGLKKDKKHRTNALINDNLEEIILDNHSNLFLLLSKIQEEVHEYTINYHRTIKSKGSLASLLDLVPGIGKTKRQLLLKRFGSLKKMKEASLIDLEEVLDKKTANNLFVYLKDL